MGEFFETLSYEEFLTLLDGLSFPPLETEDRPLQEAVDRILAGSVTGEEDLPGFPRSTMDGFALRCQESAGASPSSPVLLKVTGEVLMGKVPEGRVGPGEAWRIPTGGMVPEGADGVAMAEWAEENPPWVELFHAVAPGANILAGNADYSRGQSLFEPGQRLEPRQVQLLKALGIGRVRVKRPPRIALLSTGDELVPPESPRVWGEIRDTNSYLIGESLSRRGYPSSFLGILADRPELLESTLRERQGEYDLFLVSGGSSVGAKDKTVEVFRSFGEVLVHGLRLSPGKPLILAKGERNLFLGLPGHPLSSFVSILTVLLPLLRRWEGEREFRPVPQGYLRVERNLPSKQGRETFVPVRKVWRDSLWRALPLRGESGLISLIERSTGVIRIPSSLEGLYEGDWGEYYEF